MNESSEAMQNMITENNKQNSKPKSAGGFRISGNLSK
jgi:hypothetical protein